jgi:hypothetical protein
MTHSDFVNKFKELVAQCGLDWTQYSGHSFRRGGATFAFRLGIGCDHIKYLGDWASDAYQRYQEMSIETQLSLPRAMAEAVAKLA